MQNLQSLAFGMQINIPWRPDDRFVLPLRNLMTRTQNHAEIRLCTTCVTNLKAPPI